MTPVPLGVTGSASSLALRVGLPLGMALLKFMLHLLTNGRYGFHRDELYYIAGGLRPAWGYVDHPPLTPLIARIATELFGLSLGGLRLFPALAGAGIVVLTGLMVRRLGGTPRAEALAMLAVILTPLYLGANTLFQTVSFDQFWWVAILFLVVCLATGASLRLWLLVGLFLGLGLLTKYTMLLLAISLVVAILLSPLRDHLRHPWPWLAGLIAGILALPNFLWQVSNGFPTLTFIRNNSAAVAAEQSRFDLMLEQVMLLGPVGLPLAIAGLALYWSRGAATLRALGWIGALVLGSVLALNAKAYYAGPVYALLIAGGAVRADQWLQRLGAQAFGRLVFGLSLLGAPLMFITLPLLPPATMVRLEVYTLNGDFAEMLGWPELVDTVADVADQLTPAERATTAILTANYGQAAALELLGADRALPRIVSGHNSYAGWSVDNLQAENYIIVGYSAQRLEAWCGEIAQVATIRNVWDVPNEEQGRAVALCRAPRRPLADLWPELTRYQ